MTGGVGDSLRVDPELLGRLGNDLQSAADDLPDAPPPFVVTGADAISQAISEKLPGIEAPIQEALPQLKSAATTTASNIVTASGMYQSTDEQLAANYEKHQFDQGAPGAGGAGRCRWRRVRCDEPDGPDDEHADADGQPGCADAHAGDGCRHVCCRRTAMQGVQQIGQMTGGMGKSDGALGQSGTDQSQGRHDDDQTKHDPQQGAAPGESKGGACSRAEDGWRAALGDACGTPCTTTGFTEARGSRS